MSQSGCASSCGWGAFRRLARATMRPSRSKSPALTPVAPTSTPTSNSDILLSPLAAADDRETRSSAAARGESRMSELLVGVDVGATGVKAGLFDLEGRMVARASRRNAPQPQDDAHPDWLIWDGEEVWHQVCDALREV